MHGTWTTHHSGSIEGRIVTLETHSDGGYRVQTTQGEDYAGAVIGDGSSTTIIPPSAKGTPIDIEGETVDELREQLALEGFSSEAIEEIVAHFPA